MWAKELTEWFEGQKSHADPVEAGKVSYRRSLPALLQFEFFAQLAHVELSFFSFVLEEKQLFAFISAATTTSTLTMHVRLSSADRYLDTSNFEASHAGARYLDASNLDDMHYEIVYERSPDAYEYAFDEVSRMSPLMVSLRAEHSGSQAPVQSQSEFPISCLSAVLFAVVLLVATMVTSYVRGYRKESRRREGAETTFRQRVATAWNLQQCHDALEDRDLALEDHREFVLEGYERPASTPVCILVGSALMAGSSFLAMGANAYFACHESLSWHLLPAALALSVLSAASLLRMQGETNDPVYEDTRSDKRVTTTFAGFYLLLSVKNTFTTAKQNLQTKCSEVKERVKAQLPTLVKKLESSMGSQLSLQTILTQLPAYLLVFQTLLINVSRALTPAVNPANLPEAEQDSKLIIIAWAAFTLTLAGPAMVIVETLLWNWFMNLSRNGEEGDTLEERKPLISTLFFELLIIWRILALDLAISYLATTPPIIGTILGCCYMHFLPLCQPLLKTWLCAGGSYALCRGLYETVCYFGVIESEIDWSSYDPHAGRTPETPEQRERKGAEWNKSAEGVNAAWMKAERDHELELAARRAQAAAIQGSESDDDYDADNEWSEVEKLETEAEVAGWELVSRSVSWHLSTRSGS